MSSVVYIVSFMLPKTAASHSQRREQSHHHYHHFS